MNKHRSVSARVHRINLALFALAFILMIAALALMFDRLLARYSADAASRYAVSAAEAFGARIEKEISLVSKAAHSQALVDWLADEENEAKKALAFAELRGIVGELYSFNLYVGAERSQNAYQVVRDNDEDPVMPFAMFDKDNPSDEWYYKCIESKREYGLEIAIDEVLQRKRVWLDYKVLLNGAPLGVISTGMEFSHITGELYAQFDTGHMRGFIVDSRGVICMDSSLIRNSAYLFNEFENRLENEFSNPTMLAAIDAYLQNVKGYFDEPPEAIVVELPNNAYRFMTIAPIRYTDWSSVILIDIAPYLNMAMFLPVFAIVLLLLVAFAFAANAVGRRLIFSPLDQLIASLAILNEAGDARIYGIERKDEFGKLSNTIQDLFTKANYDALTGIYNRRFMESNISHILGLLARSESHMSVLMIDIDYFKFYNDNYGHDQGDVCLKAVAGALASGVTRTSDFAARFGGEEFIIVLPYADKHGACFVAETLLANVRHLNIPHEKSAAAPHVTVSVGAMTAKVARRHTWDEYLKAADEALYDSKQNGRDQYTHRAFEEK